MKYCCCDHEVKKIMNNTEGLFEPRKYGPSDIKLIIVNADDNTLLPRLSKKYKTPLTNLSHSHS